MRKFTFLLFFSVFGLINSEAATVLPFGYEALKESKTEFSLPKEQVNTIEAFLKLTPKQIEKLTGRKLTLPQVVSLKLAQKKLRKQMMKSEGQKFSTGIYILLAILGGAWILMGISDNWKGSKWVTNLILYVLCWLPGVIHSFVHMKEYTE
ncbi:MAG: hypothetical protein ACXVBJ_05435 [Flavisolibacter sp.]